LFFYHELSGNGERCNQNVQKSGEKKAINDLFFPLVVAQKEALLRKEPFWTGIPFAIVLLVSFSHFQVFTTQITVVRVVVLNIVFPHQSCRGCP